MIKNYVLDTNVLLLDPQSIFKFEENNVIIPIGVIEELDKFKKDQTELGKNARHVSRSLDTLMKEGDLRKGVQVGEGKVFVRYNGNLGSYKLEKDVDLHVIHIAQQISEKESDKPCIIVSRDTNVRIRANALGLGADNYEGDQVNYTEIDQGNDDVTIDKKSFDNLNDNFKIDLKGVDLPVEPFPNHYYLVHQHGNEDVKLLAKIGKDGDTLRKLPPIATNLGIAPKYKEQAFVLDALVDDEIPLVSISGLAGSGKTILAVAAGFHLTVRERRYNRLLVSRPVMPMGKDLGYLPGDMEEKLDPWMTPIYDAFDVLNDDREGSGKELVDGNRVKVEALTYIRGRSIRNQFLIIDESQNLNAHEIKTIITRAGENTKVVLTGDIYQIDNPYLDSLSNGLSVVTQKMKDSTLSANIGLNRGVRSALAEEAANKL